MCYRAFLTVACGVVSLILISSCTESGPLPPPTPPPLTTEPIGIQITRVQPRLDGLPFRVLLDFERPTDLAFIAPSSAKTELSSDKAHTGHSSLRVDAGELDIKLGSLLSGRAFPGAWTLAGAYFSTASSDKAPPAKITIAYRARSSLKPLLQRTVEVPASDTWTGVFLDLTQLPANSDGDDGLLTCQVESAAPVYCDDVLVINNDRTFEDRPATAPPDAGWTIRQRGLAIVVDRPGRFRARIDTPEANPRGWSVEEASDLRARFTSAAGQTWTLYADGRQYQDGQCNPLKCVGDAAKVFALQNQSPAELIVSSEFGRIDRDTPGDRTNDGYNEARGSYELIANGPRFEVTLKPTTPILARPVLEIAGLPAGNPKITVEGQLLERSIRLANGHVLIELPMVLDRATTVNILIK